MPNTEQGFEMNASGDNLRVLPSAVTDSSRPKISDALDIISDYHWGLFPRGEQGDINLTDVEIGFDDQSMTIGYVPFITEVMDAMGWVGRDRRAMGFRPADHLQAEREITTVIAMGYRMSIADAVKYFRMGLTVEQAYIAYESGIDDEFARAASEGVSV